MYSIGSTLNWTFTPNMVHQQGEVGEMPVIQSMTGWDDSTKTFQTFPLSDHVSAFKRVQCISCFPIAFKFLQNP